MTVQLWGGVPLITPGGDVAVHSDCCCETADCGCDSGGATPSTYTVTCSGADTHDNDYCTDCDTLNDSFVCEFDEDLYDAQGTCRWEYKGSMTACCPTGYTVARTFTIWVVWEAKGGTWQVRVNITSQQCVGASGCRPAAGPGDAESQLFEGWYDTGVSALTEDIPCNFSGAQNVPWSFAKPALYCCDMDNFTVTVETP